MPPGNFDLLALDDAKLEPMGGGRRNLRPCVERGRQARETSDKAIASQIG